MHSITHWIVDLLNFLLLYDTLSITGVFVLRTDNFWTFPLSEVEVMFVRLGGWL